MVADRIRDTRAARNKPQEKEQIEREGLKDLGNLLICEVKKATAFMNRLDGAI